ncbi:MAG: uncharacterized protein PWP76_579 [Candidatus Diapherotrites archaeon]|nr:uncharacterized protein [Candidatus Diapherotrites archaeon]MDN5367157.1 uncharacterized protein [Candidatus Diapherotrites archaeon]
MAGKYVRDPVHGEIFVPEELLPVLDSPPVQRLRRVHQLALAHLVYPAATHSRFSHSLGVLHITEHVTDDLATLAYALLHDIGHGPFSHLSEYALAKNGYDFDHDERMKDLLREALQDSVLSPREVLEAKDRVIVTGGIGTDRLDYLWRDAHFAGVSVGEIAWDRIVRNVRIADGRLLVPYKVLPNVEHVFVSRFILGDAVYFHKTVLVADEMFVYAIRDLLNHYSPEEIMKMDDVALTSAFRSTDNQWWRRIEGRELFHIVFRSPDRSAAEEEYERLSAELGEERVILGERLNWYKPPEVTMEDGKDISEVSPLVASLRDAEQRRHYYFVAADVRKG